MCHQGGLQLEETHDENKSREEMKTKTEALCELIKETLDDKPGLMTRLLTHISADLQNVALDKSLRSLPPHPRWIKTLNNVL